MQDISGIIPKLDINKSQPVLIPPKPGVEYENSLVRYMKRRVIPRIMYHADKAGNRISEIKLVEESSHDLVLRIKFSKVVRVEKEKEEKF